MTRTVRTRPAYLLIGTMVGALALAGCGAGATAQTSEQVAAVAGSNVESGAILIRDAKIVFGGDVEGGSVYAQGDDAPLVLSIVNQGSAADRIVGATSPWAGSVEILGETEIPAGGAVAVAGVAGEATAGGGAGGTQIVLTDLLDDLRSGLTYEVVLEFAEAGAVTLEVPIGGTDEPREDEPAQE